MIYWFPAQINHLNSNCEDSLMRNRKPHDVRIECDAAVETGAMEGSSWLQQVKIEVSKWHYMTADGNQIIC